MGGEQIPWASLAARRTFHLLHKHLLKRDLPPRVRERSLRETCDCSVLCSFLRVLSVSPSPRYG